MLFACPVADGGFGSLKWHYEVFRWFDKFVGEH